MTLVFLDTSVLVAAFVAGHPHHAAALPVVRRVCDGNDEGVIGAHSVAETYAVLTRLPLQPRIHPEEAGRILQDNVLRCFTLVPAGDDEYRQALAWMLSGGWRGAKIYDALLLACAAKAMPDRLYTFNVSDFRQLAPSPLQALICAP